MFQRLFTTNLYFRASEDTHVLNHFIPKDTIVLANLWAVNNDPKIWDKPDQFNPYRFLSEDHKTVINAEKVMTFSIGN